MDHTTLYARAACAAIIATVALAGCGTYSGSGVSTPVQSHTQTEIQPKSHGQAMPARSQAAASTARDFDYNI